MLHPLAPPTGLTARLLGCTPGRCHVDVGADVVELRFGRVLQASVPRAAVRSVSRIDRLPATAGRMAAGDRLVLQTRPGPAVVLELDPPQRLRVALLPRDVRRIAVTVADPDALRADLGL